VKDEKEAFYIAENQNADPKYSQLWKEDSGEIEDQTITIKEVVWDSERKDFVDK
jgi:ABC-type cobalt transport system substrate-binding protein